ncbi:MAG: RluA family pseudouridine synthase [Cyanobacteria bacterium P01_H01_bin.15]
MSEQATVIELTAARNDRLDRVLADELTDYSRSRLQKLIELGCVQVNGSVCSEKKTKVRTGAAIKLELPPDQPLAVEPEAIPLDIRYEDADILIVNKAAGMVVHPAPGNYTGTLVNALLHHCDDLAGINGVLRPGIVHRLDKETTGALVVAKNDAACVHLQAQFKSKTARREYLGVIFGVPPSDTGTVNQPIARHPVDRLKMGIVPEEKGGRHAITHYELRERLGNYSLLNFRLETGRTHQIRVHCQFLGHPLIGDRLYSQGRTPGVNLAGQALHAWQLSLTHPRTEEPLTVRAPLPAEFEKLLRILRQRQ